jgi:hypothetical protein
MSRRAQGPTRRRLFFLLNPEKQENQSLGCSAVSNTNRVRIMPFRDSAQKRAVNTSSRARSALSFTVFSTLGEISAAKLRNAVQIRNG